MAQLPAQALSRTQQAPLPQPRVASRMRQAPVAARLAIQLPEPEVVLRTRAPLPRQQQGARQPPHYQGAALSKRLLLSPRLAAAAHRPQPHLARPAGRQALALTLPNPRTRCRGVLPSLARQPPAQARPRALPCAGAPYQAHLPGQAQARPPD